MRELIRIEDLSGRAEEADGADIFTVGIDGYEGPLHLLLELARRQKVDLLTLSMLELAGQYLSFIDEARARRIDLAADYLLMASWLAWMKSRLLLPRPEPVQEDIPSGEEMAARLALRLQRLEAMRQAVRELEAGPVLGRRVFLRGETEQPKVVRHTEYRACLHELSGALAAIRERRDKERPHRIEVQLVMPIEQARSTLRGLGEALDHWASLDDIKSAMDEINPDVPDRSVRASVFSAALELTRDGEVDLRQERHFAPIYLRRITGAEAETGNVTLVSAL